MAPDAPVGQVVERIRELNELDSASLDAGQTLIAPSAERVRRPCGGDEGSADSDGVAGRL